LIAENENYPGKENHNEIEIKIVKVEN